MSQIVVDTDVASYIFNWPSSASRYVNALRGTELILSFMSVAELRMGAIAADWGAQRRNLLEQFMQGLVSSTPMIPSARLRRNCAPMLAQRVEQLAVKMPGLPLRRWRSTLPWRRTTSVITSG